MILDLKDIVRKYGLELNGAIHVGAHFGEEYKTYKELGLGKIIFFEPVKKTYDKLVSNVGSDAICHNCALGNMDGEIEINVEVLDRWGCSSILEPSSNYPTGIFGAKEMAKIQKLDNFNYNDINFMNVDVQGYELEVFKGSEKTLETVDYIMAEVNRRTSQKILYYKGASVIEDVSDYLSKFGFKLFDVNWAGISWGDGFFMKVK